MPEWTQNQINAIESTGGSVLVSAAAGSGKTSVLSERVLQMITRPENPVPADKLLIVTFTRDAAAEMKQRINDSLNAFIEKNPTKELLLQKQRFCNATVSTIDSFCGGIVREYFHSLNVTSDFRIMDDSERAIVRQKALDNVFEKFYSSDTSGEFHRLVKAFLSKTTDRSLRDAVLKISGFLECVPFPEEWLDKTLEDYSTGRFSDSHWGRVILDDALSTVRHLIDITEMSLNLAAGDKELNNKFTEPFEAALECFKNLESCITNKEWDKTVQELVSFHQLSGLARMPKTTGNPDRVNFKKYKDEIPKLIEGLKDTFYLSEQEIMTELKTAKPLLETLFEVVKAFNNELYELKLKKNALYFSDTSHLTVRLLAQFEAYENGKPRYTKTDAAEEVANRFDAVIVDEYQDINEVQDVIFNCVSKKHANLFVVGDVKQSIYGFRQTRPQLFIERRDSYHRYDKDRPVYPATVILDQNFRSRKEVCQTVNFIFELLMSRETAGIDYNRDEYLYVGANYSETNQCNTEIVLIDQNKIVESVLPQVTSAKKKGKEKHKPEEIGESSVTLEAKWIASKIRSMISDGFQVTEKNGTQRPARYSDFALLMRSPGSGKGFKKNNDKKKGAAEYVRVLSENGVPAYSEQSDSFFDAQEIKLLLNLLRIIDNPLNDIPLLSVLMSPIYGFTPDDMALIRANDRRSKLYNALKSFEEQSPKTRAFLSELTMLRQYTSSCSVDELLGKIFDTTALGAITSAVRGGSAPMSNLNLMRVYARRFEARGYKSLSDFIGYIERLIEHGEVLSSAPGLDGGTLDRVRVLSIHKSKGLEFPVCFLCDASHGFNMEDFKKTVLIDSEAGIGIKQVHDAISLNTYPRRAIITQMRKNLVAEELRLLYVALTRAREKLIITASVADSDVLLSDAAEKIKSNIINPYYITSVTSNSSMLDWILYAAAANPSTRPLMETAPIKLNVGDFPKWIFNIVKQRSELDFSMNQSNEKNSPVSSKTEIDYAEILTQNLSFQYPNKAMMNLPQKVTASGIAHSQNEYFDTVIPKPAFLDEKNATATERGSAHHEFLRYCDFEKAREDMESEINSLLSKKIITQKEADCIDSEKLKSILNNPFFDRIIQSPKIYREEEFTVDVAPSLIDDSYNGFNEPVGSVMQGAIDLAFVENGELVIVDYKTDRVTNGEQLRELYKKQLFLYEYAMRQTLAVNVSELYIFSVHLNEVIRLK